MNKSQDILPSSGIWTVKALAEFLDMAPYAVQQILTNLGIPVIRFSIRYEKRLFRLEDLKGKIEKVEEVEEE